MSVNGVRQDSLLKYLQGNDGRGGSISSLYQSSGISAGEAATEDTVNDLKNLLEKYKTESKKDSKEVVASYSGLKSSAAGLRASAGKLMETGSGSLFGKAALSGDNSEVIKEIKNFVQQYNSMVKGLGEADDNKSAAQLEQFQSIAVSKEIALGGAGVTMNSDGTLAIEEEKMKAADLSALKKAFSGSSSFVGRVKTRSVYVESNAALNERLASSDLYGRRGTYNHYLSSNTYTYNKNS